VKKFVLANIAEIALTQRSQLLELKDILFEDYLDGEIAKRAKIR